MYSFRLIPPSFIFFRRLLVGVVVVYVTDSLTLGGVGGREARLPRPVGCLGDFLAALVWAQRDYCTATRAAPTGRAAADAARPGTGCQQPRPDPGAGGANRSAGVRRLGGGSLLVSSTLDAHRLTPGRDYGDGLRGNSLGYPGREFRCAKGQGVCRIAALGDSFALGPAVPFTDNYLTQLEKTLPGVEVYNFGVSGAGPGEDPGRPGPGRVADAAGPGATVHFHRQ